MRGPGKTFKSAVGPFYYGTMAVVFIFTAIVTLPALQTTDTTELIIVIVSVLPVYILFPWILLTTDYTVYVDELVVRCGPFRFRIKRDSIQRITPSRSILSGPALSLDRLAIHYGAGRIMLVSPQDRAGFYRALGFEQQP